jgi:uncharacterized protein (TIGR02118 family)
MIKLVFALRRLPHLSREEFQRYWREQHGPLVAQVGEALRIRRYVQLHTREHPVNQALRDSRDAPEPFDGVAELWWSSLEDLTAALAQPAGRAAGAALLEDERRFIDHARSPLWVADERVLIDG